MAGGRIDILSRGGGFAAPSRIGHSEGISGGTNFSINANQTVQAAGDIAIQYLGVFGGTATTTGIGSFGDDLLTISGDLTVIAGNDLIMTGPLSNTPLNRLVVGHFGPSSAPTVTGQILVSACRDITMTVNAIQSNFMGIGIFTAPPNYASPSNVTVTAGRNINFNGGVTLLAAGQSRAQIGNTGASGISNTFVAARNNITISSGRNIGIRSFGDVFVAAGGDIRLTTTGTINTQLAYIGTNRGAVASTTSVWANGSIIAANSATCRAIIGRGDTALGVGPYLTSLDVRAGGDIQIASAYTIDNVGTTIPTTGSIFIEADSTIPTAQNLWSPTFGAVCLGPVIIGANVANGLGALSFNSAPLNVNIALNTTGMQPLVLHSASSLVNGMDPPDLLVGTAANQVQLIAPNADIDISGSICSDAFNNIAINSVANPWTNQSIQVRANRELQVNTPIASSGSSESITLVSDSDSNGLGNLLINANITTVDGNIFLSAGADPGCTRNYLCSLQGVNLGSLASVIQSTGTISSGTGSLIIQASQDVITGLNTTIISTTGIQTRAGEDTVLNQATISSDGEILMVSNRNMIMIESTITSQTSTTIVVDHNFPNAPLIGTGFFSMDALSLIGNGFPIRIYTAQQPFNSILGPLNGSLFTAGLLFQDTNQEQWCAYFNCANATPFPAFPFTIFYKNCLQQLTAQAMIIANEFLENLHPYNEYPGWVALFSIKYSMKNEQKLPDELFYIRRRYLDLINQPKNWTILLAE